ncbi:MAG TPA: agmatinase [Clostridia bacterium]|nr:agmatinase [Clostridia bacterium]
MDRNILTFLGCDSEYEDAKIVVFGAPFDSTTSFRPGARFASRNMRNDSYGLETYSPYQDKDLCDRKIFDGGDIELPFGNPERSIADIERYCEKVFRDNKIPVMIGGEHLVSLGAVRAAISNFPQLKIIHFDAHTDLRDEYLGEKLSHACVMRRIWELIGDNRIFQFGIRSGCREEFEWSKGHVTTNRHNFNTLEKVCKKLKNDPVYLTIDLDVLDPSCFPGTGTPEAGGVSFIELINAITSVCSLNVIGCDINELAPDYDASGASTATACKVLRELLLALNC